MKVEFDHLFVCTASGAPEAERLVQFGFREGPRNQHPGQGTANRRFAFANAMIELLWVNDAKEAQSQSTRRTLLWERWSGRQARACRFGICVAPGRPSRLQSAVFRVGISSILLARSSFHAYRGCGVVEPMWIYLSFMRRSHREQQFIEHPIGAREITALTLTTPASLLSIASQTIIESGILSTRTGTEYLLEIEFDNNRRRHQFDLRPHLPLIFQL
jgi:hypothetical protein